MPINTKAIAEVHAVFIKKRFNYYVGRDYYVSIISELSERSSVHRFYTKMP